jgi:sulfoxide reductase heme-binding subunit YedZ
MTATPLPRSARAPAARRPPNPRIAWPWLDRQGRFSWLKAGVLAFALMPGTMLAWLLVTGQMGAEPFKQGAREAGTITYRMLLLTLLVTPLRVVADWPAIVQVRRMLGLVTLGYALAHLGLYVAHMNGDLAKVASEIALRIYLTIGFVALLGLAALGVTSTDGAMRRMGRRWKQLHRLVVPVALLGLVHFFLQSKADVTEPTLMAGLLLWLLAWRALPRELQASTPGLLAVALVAALGTVAVEFGWYALATQIPAWRVLMANLDIGLDVVPRPAVAVLLLGLAAAAVPALRRALRGRRAAAAAPRP